MNPDIFAREEYRAYIIYKELALVESNQDFKKILEEFIEHERGDYNFWLALAKQKEFRVSHLDIIVHKLLRKIFGLTFTIKLLEGREKKAVRQYAAYLETIDDIELRKRIESIIVHERYHERELIGRGEEGRLKFVSSVVLGLNDGLIELTGALVGFAFAFSENKLVALAGVITGVSAALSMASSAYMQAEYEKGKDPIKAGVVTGISYVFVVALLVAPFFFVEDTRTALFSMAFIVMVILAAVSSFSSVILERSFLEQIARMFVFSVGVAIVAFAIGSLFKYLTGVMP